MNHTGSILIIDQADWETIDFSRNGSPVYYVQADQYKKQAWCHHLNPFVTPFWPAYRPKSLKENMPSLSRDYSYEREGRIPDDFDFEFSQIEFIVREKYEDMAKFPAGLKDAN